MPETVAFNHNAGAKASLAEGEVCPTLRTCAKSGSNVPAMADGCVVRRLTPTECERLQGFPDGWTDVPYRGKEHPADGPRYKALGNSMAVPVMRWIGERMEMAREAHGDRSRAGRENGA